MRKRIILIMTSLLLVLCSLFTACTFELGAGGCTGNKPGTGDQITEDLKPEAPTVDANFRFQIEKINGWYYPTLTGVVTLEYYPDKVTVVCNEEETTLQPVKIDYVNGLYEFRYEQSIVYELLKKGQHKAIVYSFSKSTKTAVSQTIILNADCDYGAVNIANYQTGETSVAMDKLSNYSGAH